jgi:ATP-binding cassette, subfamily B, multidrug efflux pump
MEEYLDQASDNLEMNTLVILKRIFSYLKNYRLKFAIAIILSIITAVCSAMEVLINVEIVNVLQMETIDVNRAYILGGIYAVCLFVQSATGFISSITIQMLANDIIYDLRNDVYNHILSLSILQLQSKPVGKWVTRATNDVNTIMTFFSDVLSTFIINSLYLICYFVCIFVLEWHLALVTTAFMIVIFVLSFYFSNVSKKKNRIYRNTFSRMNSFLSENLSGMDTIQIFNQQERKYNEFTNISKKLKQTDLDALKVFSVYRPLIYFIYIMTILVCFIYGFYLIQTNTIVTSVGVTGISVLFGFYQYIGYLFNPIQTIANQFNTIQQALTGAERVFLVLDIIPAIKDSPNAKDISTLKGKIEFRHVFFKYNEKQDWILNDVSFVIQPGQSAAFVGQTGAGKSTIINLIVRNYDIQQGEILIDDIPIKDITLNSLRKNVGEMLQDVFLFSGDLAFNIALEDEYDLEKVKQSCEFVGASPFIEKLENKYNSEVKESGNNFSAGQRQLISFARVVYSEPKLIILDEATSNIDTQTEAIIQSSLEKIKTIGTMVMIAHRLSTIKKADIIYVVDKGKIAEYGSHAELIKKGGIYYNLYKVQSLKDDFESNQEKNK